ncbi:MAG: bifunctional 2-methylcitrate dehydratase/aconitate hydratase [Parachlamydiaceae bacterium]
MPERDPIIQQVAAYVANPPSFNDNAYFHARLCLLDAIGCGLDALNFSECTQLLGPWIPGTVVPSGPRVFGTKLVLDPVQAAFQTGLLVRFLDYNDTFLSKEWAHPSDNLGALLPLFDYKDRPLKDLLTALIQAYEIQGTFSILNSFNSVGLDHVILVKLATAALCTKALGGNQTQIEDTISQVFIDLGPMRTYRHAPNTGMRKSWAAGDACARGTELALLTMRGEKGYLTPLSAPKWGLHDVLFDGKPLELPEKLDSYIVENILFKVKYPAEFHAQTAVEIAARLHPQVKNRLKEIEAIDINTHSAALRIIDKKGPLKNHGDRDHCIQYMTAIALLTGTLNAHDYSDQAAQNPQIDALRSLMRTSENLQFSKDYLDPEKRSIASSLTIHFKDGTTLGPETLEYPIGHKRRRAEALPLLRDKFLANSAKLPPAQAEKLASLFDQGADISSWSVKKLIDCTISG